MPSNTVRRICDLRDLVSIYYSEEFRTWFKAQPLDYRDRLLTDVENAISKLQDVIYAFHENTSSNNGGSK